jgi:formylglycine-generating enzyme required for sulfatase activity
MCGINRLTRATVIACALLLPALVQAVEKRVALVIGNSAYSSAPLSNPANDARLISDELGKLGFEVIPRINADQKTMKRAIEEFGERLEKAGPDSVGLFYYAGHGLQLNGHNYLIPTTASIEREGDVEIEAVSADWVIEQLRYAHNRLNIVILDACRNNPFVRGMRSTDHGLATMDAPAGVLIAYSTAPGDVAQDGSGSNSPFSQALAKSMHEYKPVEQVFKLVRVSVMSETADKQVPWEASSLTGADWYFPLKPPPVVVVAPPPKPAPKPDPSVDHTNTSGADDQGLFARMWDQLKGSHAATPSEPMVSGAHVTPLLASLGIDADAFDANHSYPLESVRELIEGAPRRATLGSTPAQLQEALNLCRQYAKDCKSEWYDDETLRRVKLKAFELDAMPVSVRQFREFAEQTRYSTEAETSGGAYALIGSQLKQVPGGTWRNALKKHPVDDDSSVVAISYKDAQAYCRYKNESLPSEDEWEYAARGPQGNIFPWGNDAAPVARALNVPPHVNDGPAEGIGGSYRGLSGNVWQWVDKKVDGGRVALKGGSWLEPNPANKRAAAHLFESPSRADEDSGFRCVKRLAAWPDTDVWLSHLR